MQIEAERISEPMNSAGSDQELHYEGKQFEFSEDQKQELVQRLIKVRNKMVIDAQDERLAQRYNLKWLQQFYEVPVSKHKVDDVADVIETEADEDPQRLHKFISEYLHFVTANHENLKIIPK